MGRCSLIGHTSHVSSSVVCSASISVLSFTDACYELTRALPGLGGGGNFVATSPKCKFICLCVRVCVCEVCI